MNAMQTPLARLSRIRTELGEAKELPEIKGIRDKAEAVRAYAKAAGLGLDIQNDAAEIKIRAERKAGELLSGMAERGERDPGKGGNRRSQFHDGTVKLNNLGIERKQSMRWQRMARLGEDEFETAIVDIKHTGELTSASILRVECEARKQAKEQEHHAITTFKGKYRILYADPPWKYADKLVKGYGAADHHYRQLSIAELCEFKDSDGRPLKEAAYKNSALFLWVTAPVLQESFAVISAWGFAYKTCFVWDKQIHNYGHYSSVRHELLLLSTRGQCTPDSKTLEPSVLTIRRTEKHSEKPIEFLAMIDRMYLRPASLKETENDRIILFHRGKRPLGWDVFGDQVDE